MIDSFDRLRLADAAPRGSEPPESVLTLEALLGDIDERAGYMPIDTRVPETERRDAQTTRRGWLAAAVAFGVVLLLGAATILMMNGDQGVPPVTPEVTPTTQALSSQEQEQVDAVYAAVAKFNEGDVNAWVDSFREASTFTGRQISSSYVRHLLGFRMMLGEEITVEECTLTDDGKARCSLTSVDALGLADGGVNEFVWTVKSDNGRLLEVTETHNDDWRSAVSLMGAWVKDAHPEVWANSLEPPDSCSWPGGNVSDGFYGELNCMGRASLPNWEATAESAASLRDLVDEYKVYLGS
ncbi:MAG: hypothetical protein ABFR95_03955 [Actinomycetota bacterium]